MSWIQGARKYFESSALGHIKCSTKLKSKSSSRTTKKLNYQAPSLDINRDISCEHGGLALVSGTKSKRRMIDGNAWNFLRRLYSQGREFKCSQTECGLCIEKRDLLAYELQCSLEERNSPAKSSGVLSNTVTPSKQVLPAELLSLVNRRTGVPPECLSSGVSGESLHPSLLSALGRFETDHLEDCEVSEWVEALSACEQEELSAQQPPHGLLHIHPLLPGIYHLVSRDWLRQWRRSLRDGFPAASPSSSALLSGPTVLPQLDCTSMLCHAHGLLVVPPHVEEYLIGMRKSLLGGMGQYPSEVVEVLTVAEWEALQGALHCSADFSVRFCVDGDDISWNTTLCGKCNRYNFYSACNR